MQYAQAYIAAGFSPKGAGANGSRLISQDRIAVRISELIQASQARRSRTLETLSLRLQAQRLDLLQDVSDRMRRVIDHRSRGESAIGTGLVVKHTAAVGSGIFQRFEDREEFDRPLVEELRATGRQAAEELGEWREKMIVEWDGDPAKLTDEQLEKMYQFYEELAQKAELAPEVPKAPETTL